MRDDRPIEAPQDWGRAPDLAPEEGSRGNQGPAAEVGVGHRRRGLIIGVWRPARPNGDIIVLAFEYPHAYQPYVNPPCEAMLLRFRRPSFHVKKPRKISY